MKTITFQSQQKKEVLDITDKINELIEAESEDSEGICFLHILHTTAALSTADLDPGTDLDMLDAFEKLIPKLNYRHPHNPEHVPDHIMSTLIGSNLGLPFQDNSLILGTWQRVVLFEFDGPRERKVIMNF